MFLIEKCEKKIKVTQKPANHGKENKQTTAS
jgi:hypothetical protein